MRLQYKKSFKETQHHVQDIYENLGYRYWEKGILNRVISKELYSNPVNDRNFAQLDRIFINLVNLAKQIRTQYSIAHKKDTILIN